MLWTIESAARAIRGGSLAPVTLLEECLERIDRLEPRVRAWVLVDHDGARAQAEEAAREVQHGRWRGRLHGIPIAIKDIIDVEDWPTAAGFQPWAQSIARRDATVVRRLRQAGAVIVGKTVTTLFASFDPPVTRNPWDATRTPGGSSSGSAAAVASGMCLGAIGSQTGGSITRPASYCGVASCKPTYRRVSTDGVVPLAPSMDHVGPMAGCVRDVAILMQTIAGPDPRDPYCADRPVPDYQTLLGEGRGAPRLGRLRGLFEDLAEPAVRALLDRVAALFRAREAVVLERALPPAFAEVLPRHRTVMAVEAAAFHRGRLGRQRDAYGPRIRELVEEGLACAGPHYADCKEHQTELTVAMLACFDGVDALLTPATTGPAPDATTTGNPAFNSPWSYTGLPTVSVVAGRTDTGLPLSIQLVGRPWAEADLLATAAWCEAALGVERAEVPV
jgi:aspartyl-tRNA(Asn)/glutamyl-tRNA(Gln) amidotransferase subunit A